MTFFGKLGAERSRNWLCGMLAGLVGLTATPAFSATTATIELGSTSYTGEFCRGNGEDLKSKLIAVDWNNHNFAEAGNIADYLVDNYDVNNVFIVYDAQDSYIKFRTTDGGNGYFGWYHPDLINQVYLVNVGDCTGSKVDVDEKIKNPTVTLTTSDSGTLYSAPFSVNATFSEAVTGLEASEIVVGNGAASNLTGSGASYSFTVTPSADGTVKVDLPAGVAESGSAATNLAATQLSVTYDATAPTVSFTTSSSSPHNGPFEVTAKFSEDVSGFALSDLVVTNGGASNLATVDASTYKFDVTPDGDGEVTVGLVTNAVTDAAGNSSAAITGFSMTSDATGPTVTIAGPKSAAELFTATITFSESVTGFAANDIAVTNASIKAGSLSGSGADYTVGIVPELGKVLTLSIAAGAAKDAAGNDSVASSVFEMLAGSPATEFEANKSEIRSTVVQKSHEMLTASVSANQRMTQNARERFISFRAQPIDDGMSAVSGYVPFTMDGSLGIFDEALSTSGSFHQQSSNADRTMRQLVFGDVDLQIDDNGAYTASVAAKLAWENQVTDAIMLGYFVGIDVGHSNISGGFEGTMNSYGLSTGGYFVAALGDNLYADGFVSVGLRKNDLDITNGTLDLTSSYLTPDFTVGTSLTGVVEGDGFEIWPTVSLSYGRTAIGTVPFTGTAYGLTDSSLQLDGGQVSLANVTFAPELRVPLVEANQGGATILSLTPRLLCEDASTIDAESGYCGAGGAVGLTVATEEGNGLINANLSVDRINSATRTSARFSLQQGF